ncbi:MAG: AAA family ATPase [Planctomycetales bacterium]
MPEHELEIAAILQTLDNGGFHGEALLFPEFSCLGDSRETILRKLEKIVQAVLEEEPRGEWHRRHLPATVDARDVPITVPPPKHGVAWRTPVEVNYQAVCWSQGEILLAYLPALRIEVSASRPEELAERLLEQAAFALQRQKATVSLRQCFFLARGRNVAVERRRILLPAPTPKQAAMEEAKESEPDVKTLKQTCDNLTRKSPPPAFHVEPMVEKLADALTGRAPSSVLLTGPSGVGKTALFHELVRRRRDFQLGATPFWATSGSRLIAGMSGFGMWQERCRDLVREASKQRAILHLGNLIELMEVGKGGGSGLGVAGFLRPLLSRGELLAVVECTPEQRSLVEREDPQLLDALYPIEVK